MPDGARRLDRALAEAADRAELSRSRIARLIADGHVRTADGRTLTDPSGKVKPGERLTLRLPPPAPAEPQPEAIPLAILHEDADLIVVDKPAGMVVHPAPGAESGTLVNALLAHCGDSLAGIGGERRPGIVHRIDKETSGLLVVAKTQAAHAGLSALFQRHDITRAYLAVVWSVPDAGDARLMGLPAVTREAGWLRIQTQIARHPTDRKRMAVARTGGREAITRLRVTERFGPPEAPWASLIECRLETGRTHQIRVHASHVGHPLVGDPVYGRNRRPRAGMPEGTAEALSGFPRQALHAARLGFIHPVTGAALDFSTPPPRDVTILTDVLRRSV